MKLRDFGVSVHESLHMPLHLLLYVTVCRHLDKHIDKIPGLSIQQRQQRVIEGMDMFLFQRSSPFKCFDDDHIGSTISHRCLTGFEIWRLFFLHFLNFKPFIDHLCIGRTNEYLLCINLKQCRCC